MCPRFAFAVGVSCIGPAVTGAGQSGSGYGWRRIANQLRRIPNRMAARPPTSSCSTTPVSTSADLSLTRSNSCSTPTTTAPPTRSACWTRWRASKCLPQFNIWAGRFLPPSDRANLYGPFYSHEWSVYTDGIQDGYPFVFQGRDNGVVYWGDFAKKVKVSVGAFDGKSATGNHECPWGRSRPDRFLGSGGRLLPERDLLRRQEPARHRRSDSDSGRPHGVNRRFPPGKETAQRRRRSRSKASIPTTTGWAGTTRLTPRARARMGWEATSFRKQVGIGKFEILGKYAKAEFTHGADAELQPENHRSELQLRHQAVQGARDDVLQGHKIQQAATRFLAGGSRPPDPDVSASFLKLRMKESNL